MDSRQFRKVAARTRKVFIRWFLDFDFGQAKHGNNMLSFIAQKRGGPGARLLSCYSSYLKAEASPALASRNLSHVCQKQV